MDSTPVVARPAAWLRDPRHPGYLRWWDGRRWTAHVQLARPAAAAPMSDPALRWVLPVGRSGWAIAAGYAGLFSVLVLPAPLAVVLGVVALRDINHHPGLLGTGRAVFGIGMGALFTAVFFLPLVVAATPIRNGPDDRRPS